MLDDFLKAAVIFFATIDPVGAVTLFGALTQGRPAAERRRIAWRAVLVATLMLVSFMVVGQLVLGAMHISLHSFQIAGAIFLFLFGAQLTFGTLKELEAQPEPDHDVATFPLAMPGIASPGALTAAVVLTDNARFPIERQALTGCALLLVLAITYGFLLLASPITRVLGRTGATIAVRALGLILAALAVEMLLDGVAAVRGL